MHVEAGGELCELVCPSAMWVMGTRLGRQAWAASVFTHWANSLVLLFIIVRPNNQSPVQMATLQNTPESLGNSLITWCPHQNCSIRLSGPEVGTSASLTNSDGHHKVCFRQSLWQHLGVFCLLGFYAIPKWWMNSASAIKRNWSWKLTQNSVQNSRLVKELAGHCLGVCWVLTAPPTPTELILSLNLPELLLWEWIFLPLLPIHEWPECVTQVL